MTRSMMSKAFREQCERLGLDPHSKAPIARHYDQKFLEWIEEREGIIAGLAAEDIRAQLGMGREQWHKMSLRLRHFGAVTYEPGRVYPRVGASIGVWRQLLTWEELEPTWDARHDAMRLGVKLRKEEERKQARRAKLNEYSRKRYAKKRALEKPLKLIGPPPPPKPQPGEIFPDDPNLEAWL